MPVGLAVRSLPALDLTALDRRCARDAAAPLIVAWSGGGDSLALLLAAKAWADGAGRSIIAATVDHGLQPAGAEWARRCAARCRRLDVPHQTLAWTGEKPTTGVPAAARAARHRLLAEFARERGASVILMGHTADDLIEARAMRAAGSTTPDPREWSPSPVWPEGRGLFVLRPLLEMRRDALRAWLAARGESWIEDPANEDHRYARARARAGPIAAPEPGLPSTETEPPVVDAEVGIAGELIFRRAAFGAEGAARTLSRALLCASGAARPPRAVRVETLLERLRGGADFTATLAGARTQASDEAIVILREAGELRRLGTSSPALSQGVPMVWDGRFEIEALAPGLSVRALAGIANRLEKHQQQGLSALPAHIRPALPAILDDQGRVTCPILAGEGRVRLKTLAGARFLGACGRIENEASIWRVAKTSRAS